MFREERKEINVSTLDVSVSSARVRFLDTTEQA
jgi:hypothetical protein